MSRDPEVWVSTISIQPFWTSGRAHEGDPVNEKPGVGREKRTSGYFGERKRSQLSVGKPKLCLQALLWVGTALYPREMESGSFRMEGRPWASVRSDTLMSFWSNLLGIKKSSWWVLRASTLEWWAGRGIWWCRGAIQWLLIHMLKSMQGRERQMEKTGKKRISEKNYTTCT